MGTLYVILAVIGVFVVAAVIAICVDRKRTGELKQVARDLGLEYVPQVYWSVGDGVRAADEALFQSLQGFHLFRQAGHSKRLWNLLRGKSHKATNSKWLFSTTPMTLALQEE